MTGAPAPLSSWHELRPALVLGMLLLAVSAAGLIWWRLHEDASPWVDVAMSGVDAVLIVAFVQRYEPGLWTRLRWSHVRVADWLLALGLFVVSWIALHYWFALLLQVFEGVRYLDEYELHGWPLWSSAVLIVVMPAVFEELAFRGFLLQRFARVMAMRDALILQALWFAIFHLMPAALPSHFALGILFGWLARRTGSLVPGMLVHAAWNACVLAEELMAA